MVGSVLVFDQLDERGATMPTEVKSDLSGILMKPHQTIDLQIVSLNATGFETIPGIQCAVKMRVSISTGTKTVPILTFPTVSCRKDVQVRVRPAERVGPPGLRK